MEPTPYTNFWTEEPDVRKKAWRPTDQVRQKLNRFWLLQGVLLLALIFVSYLLIGESRKQPTVYAKLPSGLVLEATPQIRTMDRIGRTELVNNVLPLLYYQDGREGLIETIEQNVRPAILKKFAAEMRFSKATNATVNLITAETFETSGQPGKGFMAMTKAMLTKRSDKESTTAAIYIRTLWFWEKNRFVLAQLEEVKPAAYLEAFNREKERIRRLPPEELKREIDAKLDKEITIPKRQSSL